MNRHLFGKLARSGRRRNITSNAGLNYESFDATLDDNGQQLLSAIQPLWSAGELYSLFDWIFSKVFLLNPQIGAVTLKSRRN